MYIITWKIYENIEGLSPKNMDEIGDATLFDTNLMVLSLDGGKTVVSGGQDGMNKWLERNDMYLKYPNITKTDKPDDRQESLLRLGLTGQPKHKIQDDDGNNLTITIPWSINNQGGLELTRYVGTLSPQLKPWVAVVDGDVVAFMNIKDFNKPHYGVTDYEGGGHNFWIPFMMSGGRSNVGYIMVLYLPDLQAKMVLNALKKKDDKNVSKDQVFSYVMRHFPKAALPEFKDRLDWMSNHDDPDSMFNELESLIRRKDSQVYDPKYTLDGGYVVEGQEYDDTEVWKGISDSK
jgi:hypothetical protein